jgi:hypothetical protein
MAETHLEVIHVAIRLPLVFVPTDVLQSDLTCCAAQAVRVPARSGGVDYGAEDRKVAGRAEYAGTGGGFER